MAYMDYSNIRSLPPESKVPSDRVRLSQLLVRASGYPLVFIIGGSGYGKTSLAMRFAEILPEHRIVWYRPHPFIGHTSPEMFVSCLSAAIREKCMDFGTRFPMGETYSLATTFQLDAIVQEFAKEVRAKILKPTVVILDNYHLVDRNGQVSQFITRMMDESLDNLKFVIVSRENPVMPVPSLVASDTAFVISEAEMCFTLEETIAKICGSSEDPGGRGILMEHAVRIHEVTRGYPLDVLFAGLIVMTCGTDGFIGALDEYLKSGDRVRFSHSKLLGTVPEGILNNVMALTVFQVFDEEAAGFVIPAGDFRNTINNMLLWRYVEVLRTGDRVAYVWVQEALELMTAECERVYGCQGIRVLRIRAAEAYLKRMDEVSAAKQLLQAGEFGQGVHLLGGILQRLLKGLRYTEAQELLDLVPKGIMTDSYPLLMAGGDLQRRIGHLGKACDMFLAAADYARSTGDGPGLAEALTAYALLCMEMEGDMSGRDKAIAELDGMNSPDARLNGTLVKACIRFVAGDFAAAYAVALEAVSSATGSEVRYPDCLSFLIAASLAWGELREAERFFTREVAVRKSRGEIRGVKDMVGIGNSMWLISVILYAVGDIQGLENLLEQTGEGLDSAEIPGISAVRSLLLAFLSIIRGDDERALAYLRPCGPYTTDEKKLIAFAFNDETTFFYLSEMTEIYVRRGELALARIYMQRLLECSLVVSGRKEYRMMAARAHAECHLAERDSGKVLEILSEPLDYCLSSKRQVDEVRIRIVRAKALAKLGRTGEALAEAKAAVCKASEKGYSYIITRDFGSGDGIQLIGQLMADPSILDFKDGLFLKEAFALYSPALARTLSLIAEKPRLATGVLGPSPLSVKRVRITSFGNMEVSVDGQPVSDWRKQKAKSLLAMLLVSGGRQLSKDYLADILWPDADPVSARNSLRNVLHSLRKALTFGDTEQSPVESSRNSLWLDMSSVEWDLTIFKSLIVQIKEASDSLQASGGAVEDLFQRVTSVYTGDFLQDAGMAELFLEKRNRYRVDYVDSLCRLGGSALQIGDYNLSIRCYSCALDVDVCAEQAHKGLMEVYLAKGDREAAINQYRTCRTVLGSELGVAPDHSTDRLFECVVRVGMGDRTSALRFVK